MTTDPLATTPPAAPLPSRAVAERALHLPVRAGVHVPRLFVVASGSEPIKAYQVFQDNDAWSCDCIGGAGCSHVWAARAHADPATRRALQALVRPARRMGEAAAARLVNLLCAAELRAALTTESDYATARAYSRRDALAARIVARLTGHADDDAGGAA